MKILLFLTSFLFLTPLYAKPNLLKLNEEELDSLYLRGVSGAMPDGVGQGQVLMAQKGLNKDFDLVFFLWQGKAFERLTDASANVVNLALGLRLIKAKAYVGDSWFELGGEAIVIDYQNSSILAKSIRDEIRAIGGDIWLGRAYLRDAKMPDSGQRAKFLTYFSLDFN